MASSIALSLPLARPAVQLEIQFYRHHDRWGQRWQVVGDPPTPILIMDSLEGDGEVPFPTSPPIQDLDHHALETGDAILGVGMAGTAHWSASLSTLPGDDHYPPGILADLACLEKSINPERQAWLGSTYQLSPEVTIARGQSPPDVLLISGPGFALQLSVPGKSDQQHRPATSMEYQEDFHRLVLTPASRSRSKTVSTRWQFFVSPSE